VAWAKVYFRTKWRLHPSSHLATVDMGRKLGGCAPFRAELGPCLTQRHLGRSLVAYPHTKWHLDPSSRLATTDIGQKLVGGLCLFFGGGSKLGNHLTHTKWHLSPSSHSATTDMGRKLGFGLCPFMGGGAGSPSNTVSPRMRPTSIPSGILMHPAIWPQ